MSVRPSQAVSKTQVSPKFVVVAVVVLVAFVAWVGIRAFSGPTAGPLPPPPTAEINLINQMARQCQGDFTKLSPEDQAKVQQITHGFGAASMASTWRHLSKPSQ